MLDGYIYAIGGNTVSGVSDHTHNPTNDSGENEPERTKPDMVNGSQPTSQPGETWASGPMTRAPAMRFPAKS